MPLEASLHFFGVEVLIDVPVPESFAQKVGIFELANDSLQLVDFLLGHLLQLLNLPDEQPQLESVHSVQVSCSEIGLELDVVIILVVLLSPFFDAFVFVHDAHERLVDFGALGECKEVQTQLKSHKRLLNIPHVVKLRNVVQDH